jgi:hypothetical protein
MGKRILIFREEVVSRSISTLGNIEIRLPLDVATYPRRRNPPQIGLSFLSYRWHWTVRYRTVNLTHWQWHLDIRWYCSGKQRWISKPLKSNIRCLFYRSVTHISDFYVFVKRISRLQNLTQLRSKLKLGAISYDGCYCRIRLSCKPNLKEAVTIHRCNIKGKLHSS